MTMQSMFDGVKVEAHTGNSPSIRSVYYSNSEVLRAIASLHCPDGFECDMTFGNGSFWSRLERPSLCFDIEPLHDFVVRADSTNLPLRSSSIASCVFDPPFLTDVQNGRLHSNGKMVMACRFSGYSKYSDLERHYKGTLSEAWRVLVHGGKLVFKCQDIIHNHKMHCTHARVIQWAELAGFRLLDLFILPAISRIGLNGNKKQKHAKIWHSYFLVFEKKRLRKKRLSLGTQNDEKIF